MLNKRLVRFLIVGLLNTLVSFSLLNLFFFVFHQSRVVSIILATIITIFVSFMFNRGYVFKEKGQPYKRLITFVVVTGLGVLLAQTLVYSIFAQLVFKPGNYINQVLLSASGHLLSEDALDINLSNAFASLAVLLWNYNSYRLLVFRQKVVFHESRINH